MKRNVCVCEACGSVSLKVHRQQNIDSTTTFTIDKLLSHETLRIVDVFPMSQLSNRLLMSISIHVYTCESEPAGRAGDAVNVNLLWSVLNLSCELLCNTKMIHLLKNFCLTGDAITFVPSF